MVPRGRSLPAKSFSRDPNLYEAEARRNDGFVQGRRACLGLGSSLLPNLFSLRRRRGFPAGNSYLTGSVSTSPLFAFGSSMFLVFRPADITTAAKRLGEKS